MELEEIRKNILGSDYHQTAGSTSPEREIASDPSLFVQKKCKRCFKYYTEADTSKECWYHPGFYTESYSVTQGAAVGWSCCRVEEVIHPLGWPALSVVRENALKKDGKGCQYSANHEEDHSYTESANKFPFHPEIAKQYYEQQKLNQAPPVEEKEVETEAGLDEQKDKNFFRHKVKEGDTLVGLSLKYDVPVDTLKKVNHIFTREIYPLKEVLIPISPDFQVPDEQPTTNAEIVRAFKRKTGVPTDEAKFYLEESNYDMNKALEEWKIDCAWEQKNQARQSQNVTDHRPSKAERERRKLC